MGGDKPANGGGDRESRVYGATAAMSSVSPNFLLWPWTRLQPQAPAAVKGGSGAASAAGADAGLGEAGDADCGFRVLAGFRPAGGGRPQGRPRRPGGALCPRA